MPVMQTHKETQNSYTHTVISYAYNESTQLNLHRSKEIALYIYIYNYYTNYNA